MNQYIITEEKLNQINTRTTKNPLGDGHGSKFLPLAGWERQVIIDEVMARPHNPQAEREKMLDELVLWNDTREIFHIVQDYKRHLRQKDGEP